MPVPDQSSYGAGGHQADVVVVDGAFLMELLDDTPAAAVAAEQQPEGDDADDRLSRVMRSSRPSSAARGCPAPTSAPPLGSSSGDGGSPASGDGGRLDQLDDVLSLSDFDGGGSSRPGSCSRRRSSTGRGRSCRRRWGTTWAAAGASTATATASPPPWQGTSSSESRATTLTAAVTTRAHMSSSRTAHFGNN